MQTYITNNGRIALWKRPLILKDKDALMYQKILRMLTCALMILALFEIVAGCFIGGGSLFILSQNASGDTLAQVQNALTHDFDNADSLSVAAMSVFTGGIALVLLITGIFNLIVGILGFRGAKRPQHLRAFIVLNVLVLACGVFNAIYMVVSDATSVEGAVSLLIPAFVQSLSLYCAISLREAWVTGKLPAEDTQSKKPTLGFITVFQCIFAANILITLGLATFLISGRYTIDPSDILMFANLIFQGIAFWLIVQRSQAARFWICGFSAFNIIAGLIISFVTGTGGAPNLLDALLNHWFDFVLLFYFLFAKKPREILVNTFTIERQKELVTQAWDLWKPTTWNFWRSMIIYFCLFSIIGHWMEAGFCTLIKWGIVDGTYDPNSGIWRDYLSPFPVYGVGMVACALALFPIKTKLQEKLHSKWSPLVISFLINTAVCAIIELVLGFTQNMPDANGVYPLWDYSDMPFNFMGQICLQNTLAFGMVATLITWVVFPALQREYLKLPEDMRKASFVAVVVFYALVMCLYAINFQM